MEKRRRLAFALALLAIIVLIVLPEVHVADAQTRIGALTLSESYLYTSVIDPVGGFAYFGAAAPSPGVVVKVRLSDFTQNAVLNIGAGGIYSSIIDSVAGFAYFGTNTGVVVKVRLSDFTSVGSLTLNPGEGYVVSSVIDPAAGFVYFGTNASPGVVVKVRLSDFTRVGSLILNTGENWLATAVIDPVAGFAYFGSGGTCASPAVVVEVRLSDLTRIGALTLNAGENCLTTSVIDPVRDFAYFGVNPISPSLAVVVKVRLSDLTRVGALSLNTQNSPNSSVIETAAGFAYFGTIDNPGIVVKVRLSDFTLVDTLTLGTGESYLFTAVLDPVTGIAYFGTYTTPAIVVKDSLFDFSIQAGDMTLGYFGVGSNTISVTWLGGRAQYVSLSCSGLPSGVQCNSFSPSAGNAPFTSILLITFTNSTPALGGVYPVNVTGTSVGVIHSTSFNLIIPGGTVGGVITPVDKLALLAPYVAISLAVGVISPALIVLIRRTQRARR